MDHLIDSIKAFAVGTGFAFGYGVLKYQYVIRSRKLAGDTSATITMQENNVEAGNKVGNIVLQLTQTRKDGMFIHQSISTLLENAKATLDELSESLSQVEELEILSTVGAKLNEQRAFIRKQKEELAEQEQMIHEQRQELANQEDMINGIEEKLFCCRIFS